MTKTCYSCKFCSKYTEQEIVCEKGVENYTIEHLLKHIDCDEYEHDSSMVKCKDCIFGGMFYQTSKDDEILRGICAAGVEKCFRYDWKEIERKCNEFKRR